MVILTFISYSVQEYLAVCYDMWDDLLQKLICPDCKCVFKKHQVRLRSAWEDCEHAQRIPILCIVCPKCRKFSTVLPDFLKPHSRYITLVREAVVTGEVAAPPCDERTARRWRASFSSTLPNAIHAATCWLLTENSMLHQHNMHIMKGKIAGFSGLRQLRWLAQKQGCPPDASGLFGWFNRKFGQFEGWAL